MIPGEVLPGDVTVTINADRVAPALAVTNTGAGPVQVGSHYHFAEANPAGPRRGSDRDHDRHPTV